MKQQFRRTLSLSLVRCDQESTQADFSPCPRSLSRALRSEINPTPPTCTPAVAGAGARHPEQTLSPPSRSSLARATSLYTELTQAKQTADKAGDHLTHSPSPGNSLCNSTCSSHGADDPSFQDTPRPPWLLGNQTRYL